MKTPVQLTISAKIIRAYLLVLGLAFASIASADTCLQWVHRTDVGTPGKRISAAMAFDSNRGVTVFFGGEYSDAGSSTVTYYDDTWEYNGVHWNKIKFNPNVRNPAARSGHTLIYDEAHKQIVLFGGVAQEGNYFGDTWLYTSDGTNGVWQASTAAPPPPRAGHVMVYDSKNKFGFMVGGNNYNNTLGKPYSADDAWTWSGSAWNQLGIFYQFSDQSRAAMAFDSVRGVSVLFGGFLYTRWTIDNKTVTGLNPWTLEFNGAWQIVPGYMPPSRQQHAMVFDSKRGAVILFGGTGDDPTVGGKTDEYIGGVGWRSLFDSGPPPRARHAMVYDSKRGCTVLFGGVSGDARYDDTWEMVNVGPVFTEHPTNVVAVPCGPPAKFHVSASGDPPQAFHWIKDGQPLQDGGRLSGVLTDTLTITNPEFADKGLYSASVTSPCGTNTSEAASLSFSTPWTLIATNGPSPRFYFGMAYDSARSRTILFGGDVGGVNNPNGETWEWNGNTWFLRATNGPWQRWGPALAYDSDSRKTVLFGGNAFFHNNSADYRAETWEWDGTSWSLRTTNGPSGRAWSTMAYDSAAKRIVLYGGANINASGGLVVQNDTWEYDGQSGVWTKVAEGEPLPQFHNGTMAYDSHRNKRVLLGVAGDVYGFIHVCEWDGTNWVAQSPQLDPLLPSNEAAPSKLAGEAIAYHAGRGLVVINNGSDPFGYQRWTWGYNGQSWQRLSYNDGAHQESYGQMVYDSARNALVQFGGWDNVGFVGGQTWELVDADHIEILSQPAPVTVGANQTARFTVTTRGKPPLHYRWRKDGVSLTDSSRFSGTQSGTLVISNASPATDVGNYVVEISNDCGSLASDVATLQFVTGRLSLGFSFTANQWNLNWPAGNIVLESSPKLTGPWSVVTSAVSPYAIVPTQPVRFFRLRQQ